MHLEGQVPSCFGHFFFKVLHSFKGPCIFCILLVFVNCYASSQIGRRLELWEELREFSASFPGPWCLAGDFNTILLDWKKMGGRPVNQASAAASSECINECILLDLGFDGPSFTWKIGQLLEIEFLAIHPGKLFSLMSQ